MIVRCQEEVSRDKRSYKNNKPKPESFAHRNGETHQCKLAAKYLIKSINLYVCRPHSVGLDKTQLTPI